MKQRIAQNNKGDMIPSSRTQKYKNPLGGILCPEKVKWMQQKMTPMAFHELILKAA